MPPYVSEQDLKCLDMTSQDYNQYWGATSASYSLQSNPPTYGAQHQHFQADSSIGSHSKHEQEIRPSTESTSKTATRHGKRVVSPYFDQRQSRSPTPHTEDSWASDEKKHVTSPLDLDAMTPKQRSQVYHDHFEGWVAFTEVAIPHLATIFPQFKKEILLAYLEHTTFVFKVYINYDPVSCLFYTDTQRLQGCGKLVLSSKLRRRLRDLGVLEDDCLYKKVRLDICSYWRTLARITLEVRTSTLNVEPIIDKCTSKLTEAWHDHETLEGFIDHTAEDIADPDQDYTGGKPGFNFSDLEQVAKLFVVEQTVREWKDSQAYSYDGPWEGLHNEQSFKTTKGKPRNGHRVFKKWA